MSCFEAYTTAVCRYKTTGSVLNIHENGITSNPKLKWENTTIRSIVYIIKNKHERYKQHISNS